MFPRWVRSVFSSPRQLPVKAAHAPRVRRNTVLGLEQLEERSLLSIGGLDLTFGTNGVVTTNTGDTVNVVGTVIQSSGKIVVAGTDTTTNSIVMARYNSNGTLDTTFGTNGVVTNNLGIGDRLHTGAIALQSDDKIIIAGTDFGDIANTFVARFNAADGSLDTTFNSQSTPGFIDFNIGQQADSINGADAPDALFINQANNSILVAGQTTENFSISTTKFAIARVTSAGQLDNTFHNGLGVETFAFSGSNFATATGIGLQSNGDIIVSGSATDPSSGDDDFALIRLLSGGGLDNTFAGNGQVLTPFPNASATANALAIQSNDSIVLGGFASGLQSQTTSAALARYTSNGVLDTTFNTTGLVTTTSGGISSINALALQSDGKIIGAGNFNQQFGVARYTTTGALDTAFGTNGIAQPSFGQPNDNGTAAGVAIQSNDGRIVVTGSDNAFSGDFVTVRLLPALLNTSIALSASPTPGFIFENVTLTATITPNPAVAAPFGSVTFLDGQTVIGTANAVNGVATLTTNTLAAGAHNLRAIFAGNTDYAAVGSRGLSFTVIDPLVLFIEDVYQKVLFRQVDQGGLTFWVTDIRSGQATRYDAALSIENSSESRGVDVNQTYLLIFDRNADPNGMAYWVAQLVSGAKNEGSFTAALFNSPEYLATHSDINGYINSVFQVSLGRPASASDLTFFSNLVQSGQINRATVVLLILGTPESYQQGVTQDYVEFLGRSPDATGLAFFLGKITGGFTPTQLAADILASDEFFADAQVQSTG
jgi:uncharacterized delta-60 repeat protein